MKRIVASVGLVALGAYGLRADSDSDLTQNPNKPWSVSATLRGFYDDNINAAPGSGSYIALTPPGGGTPILYHRSTFGYEVSPAFSVTWPWEQTTLSAGYIFSFKQYQYKPEGNTDDTDMTHSFHIALDHTFNELYQAKVSDSFVIGQEPDFLRAGNTYSTFQRLPGNNIRNYGSAVLDGQLTPLVGFEIGYANAYYNYAANTPLSAPPIFLASPGGELNRLEHSVHLDSRWQLSPDTVGVLGYQFMDIDYYEDGQEILPAGGKFPEFFSRSRDNYGHYGYLGIDQTFAPTVTGSFRAGARYTDYYNDPTTSGTVSPFVQANLRWNYAYQSYAAAGFTYDREPTDLVGVQGSGLTLDSETAAVFATLNHRLMPNFYGNLNGQYQHSTYNGGAYNNQVDEFYTFGANLEYRFSNYVASQVGYNYDRLDSAITGGSGRSFDRNRVYIGVTASY